MTGHVPVRPLTPRQWQIAQLVGEGWTYAEIGAVLAISPRTVQHHVEAIVLLLPAMPGVGARRRVRFFIRASRNRQLAS